MSINPNPAPEPFPIWVVWREDQPAHGYFATEDIAKRATIDYWEEDEPVCPDYSWRRDGPRWELVVGGEHGGVYASRHLVYGGAPAAVSVVPPATNQAGLLRWAADQLDADMERFFTEWPNEPRNSPYALGRKDAAAELRRLAAEAPHTETPDELCGRTKSVCDTEYPPCGRPAGHEEAYCRSADGKQHFLAVDAPAVVAQPGKETDTGSRIVAHVLATHTDLHCLNCTPPPHGDIWTPVTADELDDGGVCARCGADVLIPQEETRRG